MSPDESEGEGHTYPEIVVSDAILVQPAADGSALIHAPDATVNLDADEVEETGTALVSHAHLTGDESADAARLVTDTGAPRWALPVARFLTGREGDVLDREDVLNLLGMLGMIAPSEADFEAQMARERGWAREESAWPESDAPQGDEQP